MWRKTLVLVGVATLSSGCMTAEEQRAADEAKCRSYGFTRRNDAFAECLQRIDLDRSADRRAIMYDYWGRPVVFYGATPLPASKRQPQSQMKNYRPSTSAQ